MREKEENAYDWDDEISVQDAVIHNDYNTRLETHTGSVYLKNITIKQVPQSMQTELRQLF